MADPQDTEEPPEGDRKDRDGFSWWNLPDWVELIELMGRGIAALVAMIVGAFRD